MVTELPIRRGHHTCRFGSAKLFEKQIVDIGSYAFDIKMYSGQPFLINRRLFAMADTGIPDGIKCDVHGNVYSGCGDGVNIWSPGGVLLAKILVDGGVANFCFGRDGQMFLLNENKLWRAQIAPETKGALLGI